MKIGLEIHVALPTKTKLFCACSADETAEPNTKICPICMGFPGSKPVLNEAAVKSALDIANALHCKINPGLSFVRKVYFYPDLPKSFQITQLDGSIGKEGYLEADGKKVHIRRVQIEEDPAKIMRDGAYALVDFNRSGTPLVEIVTDPDIHSNEELWSFVRTLRSVLYYLGVDINREVKVDLNISLAEVRVEIKNVTGIKNLIDAAKYEIERQTLLIKEGSPIINETRAYNEKSKATDPMREKETDEEYGYIYEPDLTIFDIKEMKPKVPVYINEVADELAKKYNSNSKTIQELTMFDMKSLALINKFKDKYSVKNVIHGIEKSKKYLEDQEIDEKELEKVIKLVEKDVVITRELFADIHSGKDVKVEYNKLSDKEIDKLITEYIESNAQVLIEYKKNNPKVLNLIIGDVSKKAGMHPKDIGKRVIGVISKM